MRRVYVAGAVALSPPYAPETDLKIKRLPRVDRISLAAARIAIGTEAREELCLVVGTCYGGLQATADFLEGVAARGPAFGSPTAFHESVHHAPAGQISILLGITGLSLTCSDRELSGETALKAGADLVASGRANGALVVCAEEVVPALEAAFKAFGGALVPAEGAAAVLLTSRPTDVELSSVQLSSRPLTTLRMSSPPAQRELNPSFGLMQVARAVTRLREGAPHERIVTFAQGGAEAVVELTRA